MKSKYLFIFMIIALLTGCSSNIFNVFGTSDNLSTLTVRGCGADLKVTNRLTPVNLYPKMVECIDNSQYNNAVILFSLAGTYSYFDVNRAADSRTGNVHASLLANAMKSVGDENKRKMFGEELQRTLGDKARLAKICTQIQHIGMPDYSPDYINKNTSVANDVAGKDVDPQVNWQNALEGYLHCPG
ncbi:hypothetical protein CCS41_05250 [Candidatus Fukatsuia symbiotica]|uniref:Lipoprotein n=2 Tax=Yersiniaceae TaxID=1903411 RepID=A0A2U8I4F9_9GAMM|nr:hypothetical protein CCS41_05250 [Candidatus Fukatsuia symbiotica]